MRAYEAAAGLTPQELPDLDVTDAELARNEITQLRQTMEELKANQLNASQRIRAEDAQAQAIQQANQGYETARHVAGSYMDNVQAVADQEWSQLQTAFPGINNQTDLQRVAQQNPELANLFVDCFRDAQGKVALAQQEAQAAMQGYAANFEQLASMHDRAFLESHPDLAADPEATAAAVRGVLQMLADAGYDSQTIQAGWSLGTGALSNLRDYRVQGMLLDQWRSAEARKHLGEAKFASRTKNIPQVQRPGVGNGGYRDETELRALNAQLNETHSVKSAAKLLSAKRSYARGSR